MPRLTEWQASFGIRESSGMLEPRAILPEPRREYEDTETLLARTDAVPDS